MTGAPFQPFIWRKKDVSEMKCIRPFTFHMPFGFWSTDCHACKMIGAAFKARRGSWAKNPQMQSNSWRFERQNWLQLQICLLNNKQLLSAYHTCYLFPGSFKSCLQAKELRKASGSDKVSKPKAETCTTKLTTLGGRFRSNTCCYHVVVQTHAESADFSGQMFCRQCSWHWIF